MIKKFLNMRDMIWESAKRFPKNNAFIIKKKDEDDNVSYKNVTYTDLKDDVKNLGKYFLSKGYADKRVAVIGDNCYEWMLVFYAQLSADGVIVPLDRGLFEEEMLEQLSRAKADVVFYSARFKSIFSKHPEIQSYCMTDETFYDMVKEGDDIENDQEYESINIDAHKMSIILFTSGTTSSSKAVMLCQNNILSNVHAMTIWETLYETDVNLALLPFHHTFGMTQMVLFGSLGMCNVFCEGLRIAQALNEYGVSVLVGVPRIADEIKNTVFRKLEGTGKMGVFKNAYGVSKTLKKMKIDVARKLFSSIHTALGGKLRLIIVGAAPANPKTLEWFNGIGIVTIQGYGLTETAPVVSAENPTHMRCGSVGKALPGVDVEIFDKDEDSGIGEITVKGENVMLGYYDDEQSTAKVLKNSRFFTGDMGYMDKDGYIFITGRKKNVIVLQNGKNVFPEEIESLIDTCKGVRDSIVYNDTKNGKDMLCAKIYYDKSMNKETVEQNVASHIDQMNKTLVPYKQIRDFTVMDTEPERTTTLKIKRNKN